MRIISSNTLKRRIVLGLAALGLTLGGAACAREGAPVVVEASGLRLEARLDPAVPRLGKNQLHLRLMDAQAKPLDGAQLVVGLEMPPMGTMSAMQSEANVEPRGDGRYDASFDLPMSATWNLRITIHDPAGSMLEARGAMTTGVAGLRLEAEGAAPMGGPAGPAAGAGAGGHAAGEATAPSAPREVLRLDPARLQQIGVRSELVTRTAFSVEIRAVGRVVPDETRLADVTLRTRGWIQELRADSVGMPLERGQVLLQLYAPELYAAQAELLQALASQAAARGTTAPQRADAWVAAAKARIRLFGVSEADVQALVRRGRPEATLPIRAPVSGVLVEKDVVEGGAAEPGVRLFRIAPLDRVWVEAELYDEEIGLAAPGQQVTVTAPELPGRTLEGRVAYVYPTIEAATRTGRIRLELPNPDGALRPQMYVTATLHASRGDRVTVPTDAVIYTGTRRLVFVDLGEGRLELREVQVGARGAERIEVLQGLELGERVVTSGNFLIAAESRLRSAEATW